MTTTTKSSSQFEERQCRYPEGNKSGRLLITTKEASNYTGLSEFELRRGFKAGRYPAIELGCGSRGHRLRWNIDLLMSAIELQMTSGGD